jgi:hypothetical protein
MQRKHGHKSRADTQKRDEGGLHNLVGAIQDRGGDVLAMLQVPVDIFDRHRGIVHQNADRQGQAAQRHDIKCLARGPERHQCRQHR